MLVTISTTLDPATDLGFLLHKHPQRVQSFPVIAGTAHVFYPEATTRRCTAALRFAGRLVAAEPLWRVHEYAFAVLALESEPVNPRL